VKVLLSDLRQDVLRILSWYGYPGAEADAIADVLLYAQIRGSNQGVVKLTGKGMPRNLQAGEIEVVRETPVSTLVDGHGNAGIVVMNWATERCLAKAQSAGIGLVGTFNTCTSTGAIGYYATKLALGGYLGFAFSGSPPTVCPYGSYEPIFGTNPISVGIPTTAEPLVLDMATAAITWFGLIEAHMAGRQIVPGAAYDASGCPTTDPEAAMHGAIRTFDRGHKSSGLSMIVEILTGPLVSASCGRPGEAAGNLGNLVAALDPGLLADTGRFRAETSQLIGRIRQARPLPPATEVLVPGEREERIADESLRAGTIEIDEHLYTELKRIAVLNKE